MDQYYLALATALRERLAIISNQELRARDPEAQLLQLKQASDRIDQLRSQLPRDSDPMLRHYLDRLSLTKALEFIEQHHMK